MRRAILEESSSSSGDELVSEDEELLGTGVIGCGFAMGSLLSSRWGLVLQDVDLDSDASCWNDSSIPMDSFSGDGCGGG